MLVTTPAEFLWQRCPCQQCFLFICHFIIICWLLFFRQNFLSFIFYANLHLAFDRLLLDACMFTFSFYPSDAMLARFPCPPSVCVCYELVFIETTGRIEMVFGEKAPCYLSYTAFKENSVTSNKSISLLNFFLNSTLDLENFAMHSISIAAACCQLSSTKVHGRSYRDKLDRRRSGKFTMGNESAPIQLA